MPRCRPRRARRTSASWAGRKASTCCCRRCATWCATCGRDDVHFGLVGGGTSLEEMKALARELGIADYVTFTGRVPDAEMLAMLNTADVCVNPDVANEMNDKSTMNKIMEYMALGKPIVQFDLTEGRFSAQEASLYAKKNDPVDFGGEDRRAARRPGAARAHGRLRPPAGGERARMALRGAEAPVRVRRALG